MRYSIVKVDITPSKDYLLAGFGVRSRVKANFGTRKLSLSLVRLKSARNDTVWVSMDTLYFPLKVSEFISYELLNLFSISSDNVLFNATHTHAAPNLAGDILAGDIFGEFNTQYLLFVQEQILAQLHKLSDLCDCTVNFWEAELPDGLVINRRRVLKGVLSSILRRKVVMQPNYADNKRLPLYGIDIVGDDGSRILLYSFSCHPTFVSNMSISADFPGYISSILEETKYTNAIFFQGFCGDLRPALISGITSSNSLGQLIKNILLQKTFRPAVPNDLVVFAKTISELILRGDCARTANNVGTVSATYSDCSLKSISGDYSKNFRVSYFMLNDDIVVVSIPAEVLYGFYEFLSDNLVGVKLIPLGFSVGMIGYLPQESDIVLGGYEVESAVNYGWPNSICPKSISLFKQQLLKEIRAMSPKA